MASPRIRHDIDADNNKPNMVVNTDTCLEDAPFRSVRPLVLSMTFFGLMHGNKRHTKWDPITKVYATVVLLILWANFFRAFTMYEPEEIDATFFLTVIVHCWSFQSACCATTTYLACRKKNKFVEFLSRWSKVQKLHQEFTEISPEPFLKRAKFAVYLCFGCSWVALLTSFVLVGYSLFLTSDVDFLMSPFTPKIDYAYLVKCFSFVLYVYGGASWIFTLCMFHQICVAIYAEFQISHEELEKVIQSDGNFADVEKFRRRHQEVCLLVDSADDILSGFNAVSIGVSIVNGMLVLYNILWNRERLADTGILLTNLFWIFSCLLYMGVIAIGGGYVNHLAHSPLKTLHSIQLKSQSAEFSLQMTMFLNKLSGEPIGLTAMGLFVIDRPAILTIAGAFMTYFIVLVQFQQTSGSQGSFTNFTASNAG